MLHKFNASVDELESDSRGIDQEQKVAGAVNDMEKAIDHVKGLLARMSNHTIFNDSYRVLKGALYKWRSALDTYKPMS